MNSSLWKSLCTSLIFLWMACGDSPPQPEAPPPTEGTRACTSTSPELDDFRSNLPLVIVDTLGRTDLDDDVDDREWRNIVLTVVDVDATGSASLGDTADYTGGAAIRIRGNSSVDYPKKQFAVELRDSAGRDTDASLLGIPEEEDWILHAPYSDKTLQRNVLMYALSNSIGRYAARTRFVELFVCEGGASLTMDDYRGLYVLMEKIKRDDNRIAVEPLGPGDIAEPNLTGGYVLRRDWEPDEPEAIFATSTYDDVLEFDYPKPERITAEQRDYITGYIDDFEQALSGPSFADPDTGYQAWIDVDSFIDHHLLIEMARSVDGFVLSTWLQKARGGKLAMGPIWDFNGALGNADYFEAWETQGWHHENPEFPADNPNGYRWYQRLFEDPGFRDRYQTRWQELRAGPLTTAAIMAVIDEHSAQIEEAAARNFERWPVLGEYVWPNDEGTEDRSSFAEENQYLKTWLEARLQWMDSALAE